MYTVGLFYSLNPISLMLSFDIQYISIVFKAQDKLHLHLKSFSYFKIFKDISLPLVLEKNPEIPKCNLQGHVWFGSLYLPLQTHLSFHSPVSISQPRW